MRLGPCLSGYQSQIAVDSNNCGLPSSNVNIACPALARACSPSEASNTMGGGLCPTGQTWNGSTCSSLVVVNGACGLANGTNYVSAPTNNFCTAGTTSAITFNSGLNYWTWQCVGIKGGTSASCSAKKISY